MAGRSSSVLRSWSASSTNHSTPTSRSAPSGPGSYMRAEGCAGSVVLLYALLT